MNTQETNIQNQCVRILDRFVEGALDAPVHQEYAFLVRCLRVTQLFLTTACLTLSSLEATGRFSDETGNRLVLASFILSVLIPLLTVGINALEGRVPFFTFSLVDTLAFATMALDLVSALPIYQGALSGCHFHIPSMCLGIMFACLLGRALDLLRMVLVDYIHPQARDEESPQSIATH
nr:hypothetical protein Iba_scaffold3961.4CG0220 [Ipomoea batatas]